MTDFFIDPKDTVKLKISVEIPVFKDDLLKLEKAKEAEKRGLDGQSMYFDEIDVNWIGANVLNKLIRG